MESLFKEAADTLSCSMLCTEAEDIPPCSIPSIEAVEGLSLIVSSDGNIP